MTISTGNTNTHYTLHRRTVSTFTSNTAPHNTTHLLALFPTQRAYTCTTYTHTHYLCDTYIGNTHTSTHNAYAMHARTHTHTHTHTHTTYTQTHTHINTQRNRDRQRVPTHTRPHLHSHTVTHTLQRHTYMDRLFPRLFCLGASWSAPSCTATDYTTDYSC